MQKTDSDTILVSRTSFRSDPRIHTASGPLLCLCAEQVGVPWRTCCLLPAGGMDRAPAAGAANVTYFIKAERISHNFAPGGLTDQCTGEPLDAETMV